MRILLPTCLKLQGCHTLDVWLMGIFQHDCCIDLSFDPKSTRIKLLLRSNGSIVDDAVGIIFRV